MANNAIKDSESPEAEAAGESPDGDGALAAKAPGAVDGDGKDAPFSKAVSKESGASAEAEKGIIYY